MANQLTHDVERLLSDLIGAFFAQATLKKTCEDMGVKPVDLGKADLPALADRIEKSVSFIKGKDRAALLAAQIRDL